METKRWLRAFDNQDINYDQERASNSPYEIRLGLLGHPLQSGTAKCAQIKAKSSHISKLHAVHHALAILPVARSTRCLRDTSRSHVQISHSARL
jgi:hypothetical protein